MDIKVIQKNQFFDCSKIRSEKRFLQITVARDEGLLGRSRQARVHHFKTVECPCAGYRKPH